MQLSIKMSSFIAKRVSSLNLYKSLYKVINRNEVARTTSCAFTGSFLELLRTEFDQNSVSDSKYCVPEDQQKFLGQAYLTYLESTERTLELYSTYAKGERSTEQAAAIVGLKLPKLYEDPPKE